MKRDGTPECVLAIYDRPRDFPDHIVIRQWLYGAEGKLTPQPGVSTFEVGALGPRGALSAARSYCKRLGLRFLPRDSKDDPVLLESVR